MSYSPCNSADRPPPTTATTAAFDHCMFALAVVLLMTVITAASILVTLPEALEVVASPAFGAPWITASVASSSMSKRADTTAHAMRCELATEARHD